jgi:hypothetical protein
MHLVDADAISRARGLVGPGQAQGQGPSSGGSSSNEIYGPPLDTSSVDFQLSFPPLSPDRAHSPSILAPERSSRDRFRSARRTNTSLQLSLNPTPSVSPTSHPISLSREASPIRKSPLQTSFSLDDITKRLADHIDEARHTPPTPDNAPPEPVAGPVPLRPSAFHSQLGRSALSHEILLSSGEPSPSEERVSYLSRSNSTSASGSPSNKDREGSKIHRAHSDGGRSGRVPMEARRSERAMHEEIEESLTKEAGESPPTGNGTRPKRSGSGSAETTLWRGLAVSPHKRPSESPPADVERRRVRARPSHQQTMSSQ